MESGKAASAPTPPTREGYEFVGWDKSFDAVTSHLTVTAMYQESSTAPRFEASSVTAKAGDTVKVTIQLKNNPGVASIILSVAFDNTALTLTKVDYNHTVGGNTVQPQTMDSPIKLYWINGLANAEDDFVLATLTFTVQDDAKVGAHPITLSYQADDVYDISETNITFEIVSGKVTVK
ncbi:MAG: InlB B-repeat-containing protein [Clostridia bacterium]|nr:InlB B-repeat-containing protein [Clostridia bacterium]